MAKKQFTVPEAGSIDVTFAWTDRTDPDNPQRIVKGFSIPLMWTRMLNQFCVDQKRVDEQGRPDSLPLFQEENFGKIRINADGEPEIERAGLLLRIYEYMKNEYDGIATPEFEAVAAKAKAAATEAKAAELAVLATALVPTEGK